MPSTKSKLKDYIFVCVRWTPSISYTMINITFPDGAVREYASGSTTFDIAQSISNSLAKKALAGKFNGKLIDTTRAITEDGSLEIVTPDH